MVTMENYEELMLLYIDGELDETNTKNLLLFAAQHPAIAKELKEYEQLRFKPDASIIYQQKTSLLKKEPKVFIIGQWLRYGIAAALVLLIGIATMKWLAKDEQTSIAPTNIVKQPTKIIDKIPIDTRNKSAPILAQKTPIHTAPKNPIILTQKENANENIPIKEEIAALPSRQIAPQAIKTNSIAQITAQPLLQEISIVPTPHYPEKKKKGLLAWLPINKEKRAGLEGLKNQLEEKAIKTKELINTINKTDFVFKIGSKELLVFNF